MDTKYPLTLDAIEKAAEETRKVTEQIVEQRKILNELRHRLRWKKIEEWAARGVL